ncbi:MAG: asparagine synthase (glutamine-hydrolyzing) [Candidatus Methanomethylicaceae archaeon]
MCGITGIVSLQGEKFSVDCCTRMVNALRHRGPDDAGYLFFCSFTNGRNRKRFLNLTDKEFVKINKNLPTIEDYITEISETNWHIFFGHRRLSIIDLSEKGHQPMGDDTNSVWVIFNGEIYNYKDLKNELLQLGHKFSSDSDTEVIIYAYKQFGEKAFLKFNGMFAFALYDDRKKIVYLVRDRFGIKPLYFLSLNGGIAFASEIKSILEYDGYSASIDFAGLVEYFTFQNFFSDRTLFSGVKLLPPGHYLKIDLTSGSIELCQYWDFCFNSADLNKDPDLYVDEMYSIFCDAVKRQLVSDVEVGSYLSGGLDTSAIVSVASKIIKRLKTFCIGFDTTSASGIEIFFDERKRAEHISYIFKTEHYEMVLKSGDMEACIEPFVYHLEEPRVGQSYPNFYAAKLSSHFVKVVLSGTGGDELFGGYPWRYCIVNKKTDFLSFTNFYYKNWQRLVSQEEKESIFRPISSEVKDVDTLEIFRSVFKQKPTYIEGIYDSFNLSLYFELKTFLQGLLIVDDKLSMAHSLETRVPFLDNHLVDFSLNLPAVMKVKNFSNIVMIDENESVPKKEKYFMKTNDGKMILRKALSRLLPEEIAFAFKQGFSAPDASWFRGESIEFLRREILNPSAKIYNFFDHNAVKKIVEKHLSGEENRRLFIWSLINFEFWLRTFRK